MNSRACFLPPFPLTLFHSLFLLRTTTHIQMRAKKARALRAITHALDKNETNVGETLESNVYTRFASAAKDPTQTLAIALGRAGSSVGLRCRCSSFP